MKSFLAVALIIGFVAAYPLEEGDESTVNPDQQISTEEVTPDYNSNEELGENEMILTKSQLRLFKPSKVRNMLRNPYSKWPNAQVYYTFSDNIRKFLLKSM